MGQEERLKGRAFRRTLEASRAEREFWELGRSKILDLGLGATAVAVRTFLQMLWYKEYLLLPLSLPAG